MDMSLLIPSGDNLVTYYILPLLNLNKKSFGRHFKTSYIDKQGLKVYVELKSNMKNPLYKRNPNFVSELVYKETLFILFSVPDRFIEDSFRFINGMYSTFSKEAKATIYNGSSLPFNKAMSSFMMTHPVLQALDKTKVLRDFLVDTLDVKIHPNNELIDLPHDSWFIETKFNI